LAKEIDFVTGTVVTADFLDNVQEVESALAWGIRVYKSGANTLTLPLSSDGTTSSASVRINGLPRFITTPIVHSMAGLGDGLYNVYLTAGAGPGFTLRTSTGAATADERKIAEVDFAANAITAVRNMVDAVSGHGYQHRAGGQDELNLAGYDPLTVTSLTVTKNATTAINLTNTTAGTGITIGGDVVISRTGAGVVGFTAANGVAFSGAISSTGLTATGNVRLGDADADTLGFFSVAGVARQSATTDIKDALTSYGLLQGTSPSPLNLDGGTLTAGTVNGTGFQVSGVALAASDLSNGVTGSGAVVLAAGPALTGTPTAPTAAVDTNTTQLATTAYVVGQGYAKLASPALTGNPTAPTPAANDNDTSVATTAYVQTELTAYASDTVTFANKTFTDSTTFFADEAAPTKKFQFQASGITTGQTRTLTVPDASGTLALLASPAFTGTPTAPTAAVDTNTTQLATTAFVVGQAASTNPIMDGSVAVGTSLRYARADHVHPTDTSRAPLASPGLTGTPTAPTAAVDTNTTQLATTAYVVGQGYAKLASPSFTGTVTTAGNILPGGNVYHSTAGAGVYFNRNTSGQYAVTDSAGGLVHDAADDAMELVASPSGTGGTASTLTPIFAVRMVGAASQLAFHGVTPVARPAARTMNNWTIGSNADRSIDRNNWTLQELFDYVMTMAYDLQQNGLYA
jgi:hypothetical protein